MDADHHIKLYRRRFIPDELKLLADDKILFYDDNLIITSWNTLKPRSDFASGISAYYRKEGFKISRHYGADGTFTRWYCDIIAESETSDGLIFSDLLIDVIIFPDGTVRVVDLDEAADALEQGLITADMLAGALRSTNRLLTYIHQGRFTELTACISDYTR
jgi:protein associated with RNAse G/E